MNTVPCTMRQWALALMLGLSLMVVMVVMVVMVGGFLLTHASAAAPMTAAPTSGQMADGGGTPTIICGALPGGCP